MTKANLLILMFLFMGFSCGTTNQEEVEDAIFHARQLLTGGKCTEALEALAKIPYQPANVDFLEAMASGQACVGGYSTVTFFLEDLDQLATGQTTFLGSLTTFSTSNMTSSMDSSYNSIESAINTLIYGGGIADPDFGSRSAALTFNGNNNISVFALYMILVELGKFMNYYGDANDTTGVKSGGPQANECYLNYANFGDGIINAALTGGSSGSCDAAAEGHGDLDVPANRGKACDGIVLFNNFLDIIGNVSFSGNNSGSLSSLASLTDACTTILGAGADVCTVTTHSTCVSDTANISDLEIEQFYSLVFENMHL